MINYKTTKLIDPRSLGAGAISDNVDIRRELSIIIDDEQRSVPAIYRRVRRDANGIPVISPDRLDNRSGVPSSDVPSRDGADIGYLFDDYFVMVFMPSDTAETSAIKALAAGGSKTKTKDAYLKYDCLSTYTGNKKDIPDEKDVLLIPEQDINGMLTTPIRVKESCKINSVDVMRLEGYGRVEFYKLTLGVKPEKNFLL